MGSQAAPQAPTMEGTAQDWAKALPTIQAQQLKYAPLEAQQQIELAQRYAQPYGEALKTAQDALYPGEAKLREGLLTQAQEGMSGDMPQWMKDSYTDTFNANLGTNVGSPIGADYMSRGMLQQQQNWQDQYRNLGQSLIGTQPTFNAQAPATSNYMQGYQPGQGLNFAQQGYGTQSANWQQQQQAPYQMMSGIGNAIGGIGGMASSGMFSDKRLKENIVQIGEIDGIKIYKFNFIGKTGTVIGVIAQEIDPKYTVEDKSGYLKVKYNELFGGK